MWYKDAIFYQVSVRGFQDSVDDGIGDLTGLISRLDYLKDFGADCLWLMPIYPSPQRDDGYDVADYCAIDPAIGTVDDFRRLTDEAHRRDMRIIADLVINHTSDQHPWFQEARRDRRSPKRDYYVWSDTDERYLGTRIIFKDSETSNWTFDRVAGQFFWHRFYHHQPDLNYECPAVRAEMLKVMDFWLGHGIDGFRVDAVPYLFEAEGTNCENLPPTHDVLREMRAFLDAKYPDAILLAEANQWPADLMPYFGAGDEFHMAFNFPLMPRLFMAIRREQRRPIVDIMENLPPIPETCQWAIFLRNHDELTLEMVTDEERDYMWGEYAKDPRMRLNAGIRRRLAPLMENGRRQIELLHSLLLTLPGSPVLYYGDEIGMGDNIWLGDRNGVRTPMQWNGDRNAGFSKADPSKLYLPVITDPIYHFQAVNVEAQQRAPTSLLNWIKRLIRVRKKHPALARGSLRFVRGRNEKVVAYLREGEGQTLLIVNNLSRFAQAEQLELEGQAGAVPFEMIGGQAFPPLGETPYPLTLSPHCFFWFRLERPA